MGDGGPSFLTGLEGSGEINVATRAPREDSKNREAAREQKAMRVREEIREREEEYKSSPIKNNNLFRAQKTSNEKKPLHKYNSKQKKCQYIKLESQD